MYQFLGVHRARFSWLVPLNGLLSDGSVFVSRVDGVVALDYASHVVDAASFATGGPLIGVGDHFVFLTGLVGEDVLIHQEVDLLTGLEVHRDVLLTADASRFVQYLGLLLTHELLKKSLLIDTVICLHLFEQHLQQS